MRGAGLYGRVAAGIVWSVWSLAAVARAADGDLDPSWGVGGIGAGFVNFRVTTATATGVGDVAFLGADLNDPNDMTAWWPEEPGIGSWSGCCGWEFDVPFLERFEARTMKIDREGRSLFAGAAAFSGTGTVDRAFVGRSFGASSPFGQFDDSFADSGWTYFDDASFCDTESCRFVDLVETEADSPRYILLLERTVGGLAADYYLVGLEEDGDLVGTFGEGGYRQVAAANIGQTIVTYTQLDVDTAGRAYVLHAHFDPTHAGDVDVGLTRFDAGGDLDTTWGEAGTYFIDGSSESTVAVVPGALAIGPQGQIVLGVNRLTPPVLGIVRAFESGASVTPTIVTGLIDSAIAALAVDGLGRIVVARDTGADGLRVDRLLADFSSGIVADAQFGLNGSRFVDVDHPGGNGDELVVALVIEGADYYVFVDADGSVAEDEHVAVPVRLIGSLLFADGFESQSIRFWSRNGCVGGC